uniref:Palmitoyltransferase n=1 Tax=Lotharella oceanica TaxID=641309 RepID=A0A7S2TN34_9EUKA|mmetsp:Transcript_20102/g.37768  ORF Transcript_20102/g.37768 Transcript_20102/m.37768 type:complete len:437 (+) Transcript_20102:2-1312(+)
MEALRKAYGSVRGFRLLHWGPILTLCLIAFISYSTVVNVVIDGKGRVPGPIELGWYFFSVAMLTLSYLKASFGGPGHAPVGWAPACQADREKLQFCKRCKGFKPPRAHHCSVCNKCSLKMDHHCPWINNCVGHHNHKDFFLFLSYVLVACTHSCILLGPYTLRGAWHVFPRMHRYPAHLVLRLYQMLMAMVLAMSLVVSIGCLWAQQAQSIVENATGIEQWILRKATARDREKPFVYPYDLGMLRNLKMVLGPFHLWSCPMRTPAKAEASDGIHYPLRKGCGPYDLTEEQLQQKKLKKDRSYHVTVKRDFNTTCFNSPNILPYMCWTYGCGATFACPDCEEGRLSVAVGERILVTRVRKHWLYARRQHSEGDARWNERGWVPRGAVNDPLQAEEDDAKQPPPTKEKKAAAAAAAAAAAGGDNKKQRSRNGNHSKVE